MVGRYALVIIAASACTSPSSGVGRDAQIGADAQAGPDAIELEADARESDECAPTDDECGQSACDGTLSWAVRAGGAGWDIANDVAADTDGSVVVAGAFTLVATFGAGDPNQTSLIAEGDYDIYLARYSPDGALDWARRAGGPGNEFTDVDIAIGVDVGSAGEIYVVGEHDGDDVFGAGEPGETVVATHGLLDGFVARYAPDGSLVWAVGIGGESDERATDVAAMPDGGAIVSGWLHGVTMFESTDGTSTNAKPDGGEHDLFIARYSPDGVVAWVVTVGGPNDDFASVAVDAAGAVYASGIYTGPATFGAGEPNETTLDTTTPFYGDVFVARYSADGALEWVHRAGGDEHERVGRIEAHPDGGVVITGYFYGTAVFGPGDANETPLTSLGVDDVFIARYAPDGSLSWAKRAGGQNNDFGFGLSIAPDGGLFAAGVLEAFPHVPNAEFGAGETCATALALDGAQAYIARYTAGGALEWVRAAGSVFPERTEGRSVASAGTAAVVVVGTYDGTPTFGAGEAGSTTLPASTGGRDVFIARYRTTAPAVP